MASGRVEFVLPGPQARSLGCQLHPAARHLQLDLGRAELAHIDDHAVYQQLITHPQHLCAHHEPAQVAAGGADAALHLDHIVAGLSGLGAPRGPTGAGAGGQFGHTHRHLFDLVAVLVDHALEQVQTQTG